MEAWAQPSIRCHGPCCSMQTPALYAVWALPQSPLHAPHCDPEPPASPPTEVQSPVHAPGRGTEPPACPWPRHRAPCMPLAEVQSPLHASPWLRPRAGLLSHVCRGRMEHQVWAVQACMWDAMGLWASTQGMACRGLQCWSQGL